MHIDEDHVAKFNITKFRGVNHMEGKDDGSLLRNLRSQARGELTMGSGPNSAMSFDLLLWLLSSHGCRLE